MSMSVEGTSGCYDLFVRRTPPLELYVYCPIVSADAKHWLIRHIFCPTCASTLDLSSATNGERHCPACQTILVNPDDVVITALNPTEDYKTSVLSGLDPNTIMECAGRALLFWTYQTTQEMCVVLAAARHYCVLTANSYYQEFLAKTLTDRYTGLNTQMDKVIHNANTEISTLQTRLSGSCRPTHLPELSPE